MFSLSPLVFLVTSSFTSSSLLRFLGRSDSFSRSRPQRWRSVFTNFNVFGVKTLLRHMRRLTWRGARTRSVHFSIGLPVVFASAISTFSELGEDALKFVVDQRIAFAVAKIGFVLDLELCQDVFGAELVGVVDRVQNHRLEPVIAFDDFGACLAQFLQ